MHSRITQRTAKRKKPAPPSPPSALRRYVPLLLVVVLLCGLGLRLAGLSHGLSEAEIYHPDTPHLLSATRHFLEGTYFFRVNHLDYDGYPYFYSHVVEWLWRGIRGITSFFSHLLLGGEHTGEPMPHLDLKIALFWLARITNVVLSTLAILIVYRIAARNIDRVTGLIAAGLLAVSPMNVAMAHFATNDTLVCFFTTLTVLFAVRICTTGRWYDYLVGGVLVACSFSAKYHGAIVGFTCLLGHILRYWPPRKLFGREPLCRIALMAVAFFVTVLLANPCFLVSPEKAFHDFRQFIRYIPGARLTEAQMEMGLFGRAWLSCTLNFPILLRSLGPIVIVVGFAGLIRAFFRGKRFVVLASFPAFYLLFTFLSKPVQQRFYLAAFFPMLFLLAAALLVELTQIKKIRTVGIIAVVLILSPALFYYSKSSLREVFFFSHLDTRKIAKEWAKVNIPSFYKMESGDYTFSPDRPVAQADFRGTVFLSSSIRPVPFPENSFLLKVFGLEADALPLFRNPTITIRADSSPLLSEGFVLPVYQRIPSRSSNDFVFADGATFYQDEKMVEVGADRPVSRILVSSKPIDSAIVIVKNGSIPGSVRIRFGGITTTFPLDSCEAKWEELQGLRKSFPSSSHRYFYKLSASVNVPAARLLVALTSEEKGVALYNIAKYDDAYLFLMQATRKTNSPVLAAMAYVSGKLSLSGMSSDDEIFLLEKASPLEGDLTPETIRSAFGISLDYLEALPYLSFKPHKHSAKGFHSVQDLCASGDSAATLDPEPPEHGTWRVGTRPIILEPGCYQAIIRARCEPPDHQNKNKPHQNKKEKKPDPDATIKVSLVERRMKVILSEKEFPVSSLAGGYAGVKFPFEKPTEVAECWVLISSPRYLPLFVDRIEVRPHPLKSLQAMQRLLRIVTSEPDSLPPAGPLDYNALLVLGRQHLNQNQHHESLPYYLLAHKLRPDLAEPIRRIQSMGTGLSPEDTKVIEEILTWDEKQKETVEIHEASVAFRNDVKLTGYAISRGPFRPGEKIGVSLYWSVPRTKQLPKDLIVWVHFVGSDGERPFQLDHYLSEDIRFSQKPERVVPILSQETEIPHDATAGKYGIEVGLWIPLRDWRAEVTSTYLPHTRYSATIGEIVIEPR